MVVTVRQLLEQPRLSLSLIGGEGGLDKPIRFPHISELEDPTPWLSGGELLLTTGMGLSDSPDDQRAYLGRLHAAGLSGLGFGVGFRFDRAPSELRAAADRQDFALFEVPYPVPFIAITEAVAAMLAEERLRDAQMSVEVHDRLTSLISEKTSPADVLGVVVSLASGWAMVLDGRGEPIASAAAEGVTPPSATDVWRGLPRALTRADGSTTAADLGPQGTRVALAVLAGSRREAFFVFGKGSRLSQRDRIVVRHAVTVLGLLLASRRAVIDAERRIAGDVLSDGFAGRLTGAELVHRLELVGFTGTERLTALVLEPERSAEDLDDLAWAADALLGARAPTSRTSVVGDRVVALVAHDEPRVLAEALAGAHAAGGSEVGVPLRVGIGNSAAPDAMRDSYLSAVFALRSAPECRIASAPDLGAFDLLLGAQSRPVLQGFVRSLVGPLVERDRERSSELVTSLRAYLEAAGRWEQGAQALGIHRHTLRYRIRQAEALLGRDLSSAEDRLELWLALKALEVLDE